MTIWKRLRVGLVAATLAGGLGCSLSSRHMLSVCDQQLRAAIQVTSSDAVIGKVYDVTFAVTNSRPLKVEACFGEAFEVSFFNKTRGQGWAETVDHPSCVQRFALEPGEVVTRTYRAQVPEFSEGPAQVHGGVQVVNPLRCDKTGCESTWLKITNRPEVVLRRAG